MLSASEPLEIRKYPNRRFYLASQSRHVTLQDVHEIIMSGQDVRITDSKTNEDITNVVLLQILLEKDQPKLDIFPASVLHLMIRSNAQVVRQSYERFFGPFMAAVAQSQKQFDDYLRQTMRGPLGAPMNWANSMMRVFTPTREVTETSPSGEEAPPEPTVMSETDELRWQIEELKRRVEKLGEARNRSAQSNEDPQHNSGD